MTDDVERLWLRTGKRRLVGQALFLNATLDPD